MPAPVLLASQRRALAAEAANLYKLRVGLRALYFGNNGTSPKTYDHLADHVRAAEQELRQALALFDKVDGRTTAQPQDEPL